MGPAVWVALPGEASQGGPGISPDTLGNGAASSQPWTQEAAGKNDSCLGCLPRSGRNRNGVAQGDFSISRPLWKSGGEEVPSFAGLRTNHLLSSLLSLQLKADVVPKTAGESGARPGGRAGRRGLGSRPRIRREFHVGLSVGPAHRSGSRLSINRGLR